MAIQPIKFLVSPSATATNGAKTITVTGNIDCSFIYSGTAIALGNRQLVEAVSGTKPDGSGNSVITLRDSWAEPTTTAKLVAFNTIEGLAEAIRRAREVVQASEAALSGNISYMGDHSAATGNFPAAPGEGLGSQIYRISIAGTISERDYKVGELIYYDQYLRQWRSFFDGFGNAAQRNIGSGTSELPDNQELNRRLGTSGVLGNAAQTTLTSSAIDASAGRATKVGDFGLGATYQGGVPTPLVPNANLDGIGPMGHYRYSEDMVGKPNFGSGYGTLFNLPAINAGGLNYGSQVAVDYSSNEMGFRQLTGNVWSGWCRNYHNRNVVGAVAQSGGVPTGSIIEQGANANGSYVRYADGTQICFRLITSNETIANGFTGVFASNTFQWNYPALFAQVRACYVSANSDFGALPAFWAGTRGIFNGYTSYVCYSSTSYASPVEFNVCLMAIGRWY